MKPMYFPLRSSQTKSGVGGPVIEQRSPDSTAGDFGNDGVGAIVMGTAPLTELVDVDAMTTSHAYASHKLHASDKRLKCGAGSIAVPLSPAVILPSVTELTNQAEALNSPPSAMSPISAMRRAMEKGARPMRRPHDASAASPLTHARSGSGGDRDEAAKATALRRDVVRRTLSLLGLPTSTGVSAGVDRCEAAVESPSQVPEDGAGVGEHARVTTSSQASARGRLGSALAPEVPSPSAAVAPRTPAEGTQVNTDAEFPRSPVVRTFGAFLQLMQPAPPPPIPVVSLSDSQTARSEPCSTVRDSVAGNGQQFPTIPPLPPPLPLPPPYGETPAPQTAFGAGTFASAQDLVAHVRLLLPWMVFASKKRRRVVGGADGLADDLAMSLLSLSSLPIPAALERTTRADSLSFSQPQQRGAPPTRSAAITCRSTFVDGKVTLVSDHVDAVLPTWAYLSSHIADAVPPMHVISVPTVALARDDSLTIASTGSCRHRCSYNHHSSMANSIVGGVATSLSSTAANPLIVDELVDRQSCLYPHGLAEACALAQLRRLKPKTATAGASAQSSLRFLRLELQVDVRHIPPTVRGVAPAERQCMLDQALTEFTLTGVLPTTVLRGVLNDAALRLLASVDEQVLRQVAGEVDLASQAEVDSHDGDASSTLAVPTVAAQAHRQRVVPLSLHVHTLQGEPGGASSHTPAASPISGETGSLRHIPTGLTTTPTQLILTVLVHIQQTSATFTASEAQETPATNNEQKPQANEEGREGASVTMEASSSSSAADATARMDDNASVSLASTIVPHLFPLTFGLSRFTTKLSLSSAVDYDVQHTTKRTNSAESPSSGTAEAVEEEAAAVSAGISGLRTAESRGATTATTTEEGPRIARARGAAQPWAWQDISLGSVRAWCGLAELKPLPTSAAMMSSSSPPAFSRVARAVVAGADSTASMSTFLPSQTGSKQRRSLKKALPEAATTVSTAAEGVVVAAAATVSAGQGVSGTAAKQEVISKREMKGQLVEDDKDKGEFDDGSAISVSLRRCDVAKETMALTAAVEAVRCCVDALCGHARRLRVLMDIVKDEVEAVQVDADNGGNGAADYCGVEGREEHQRKAHAGRRCTVVFASTDSNSKTGATPSRRCVSDHAHMQDIMVAVQKMLGYGLTRLIITCLSAPESAEDSEASTTAENAADCDAEKRNAGPRSVLFSMLASAEGSDDSDVAPTCSIAQQLRRWFSVYGRYLTERVCAPLEELEMLFVECTSSAATTPRATTATPTILKDGNGSPSDVSSPTRQAVLGAQVMLKDTRRHRRPAAGVDASQDEVKWSGAGKTEEADEYAVDSTVLPALSVAKAAVQLCRMMAGTSAPLCDAGAVASCKEFSRGQHMPMAATSSGGLATMSNTVSLIQRHDRRNYRSISRSPFASIRMVGAAAGALHSLHERVASLVDTITRGLRLLEAEEQRWATLQEPLACLREYWCDIRVIINKERVQRCEVTLSSLVALERQMRGTLAMEEVRGWSSIVEEEITSAAEAESASAVAVELGKLTVSASQSRTFSQRCVAQLPIRTPVATLPLMRDLSKADLSSEQSLEVPQRTTMAEECKEERATAGSDEHSEVEVEEWLLKPLLPKRSHLLDVERDEPQVAAEGELQGTFVGDAIVVESGGDDGIEASTEKLDNQPVEFAETMTSPPSSLLSTAASNSLTATPAQKQMPQPSQLKQNGLAKRSRQAPTTQPQSQTQSRGKASCSRTQVSQDSSTPPISLPHSRSLAAASSSLARLSQRRGAAAADASARAVVSMEGALALAPLNVDVIVLRQATPFVAVGVALFLLLLFL
ncbi:hypothetical protein, conserved [Leishmania lindenbergi]|uniref:Cysteine peptidase B (CPB) n=1 Tax=Leishmania lindenbergi TaxID=651832 RepID=A0AAW3ASG4_9TRYP